MRWSFSSVAGSQSCLDSDNHRDSHPRKGWWSGLWSWEKKENEQQRSQHLPQPSCHGLRIYMRARHLWLTLSTFHTYMFVQCWWMQVGLSIPLKPGFIAQNQSRYEELYGRELKDRNRQGGPLGYIFPLQAFSSPLCPSFPPSKTKLFSFFLWALLLIRLDSPFTCVVWCQLLRRFLYYLSLCVYLLLNQSLSFSRTKFVLLTSICSSWSLPQCYICRYLCICWRKERIDG